MNRKHIIALAVAFLLGVGISQLAINFLDLDSIGRESPTNKIEMDKAKFEQTFQKLIDALDRNWTQYHATLEGFKDGSEDLSTTAEGLRLELLEQQRIIGRIEFLNPVDELDRIRFDKMLIYAREQLETIEQTSIAADSMLEESISDESDVDSETSEIEKIESKRESQSKILQDIMIRNSPAGLFILGTQD